MRVCLQAYFGCASAPDGTIYAAGGHDGTSFLSSCEAYNPTTDKWRTIASMGTPRAYFGLQYPPWQALRDWRPQWRRAHLDLRGVRPDNRYVGANRVAALAARLLGHGLDRQGYVRPRRLGRARPRIEQL